MTDDSIKHDSQSKTSAWISDLLQAENTEQKIKELAKDATALIQKHPWLAVAGAAALGFVLASMTQSAASRSRGAE